MAKPSHVLIIGGGLAGPSLAIALAKRSIKSTILEIRSEPGNNGGAIMLAPNALCVLDKVVGVYEAIKSAGYSLETLNLYTDSGMALGRVWNGDRETTGYPAIRIKRPIIHQILLQECERYSEMITIKYGETLVSIEEDEGVTARFESGLVMKGDILIGTDGMHSRVRKHVLGDRAPIPTYSGLCGIGSSVEKSKLNFPPGMTLPAMIYTPHGFVMIIPTGADGSEVGWSVQRPVDEKDRQGWLDFQGSGEAARITKADYSDCNYEPIRSIMENITNQEVKLWAPYEIPDLPTWHTSRVCLLGDAAHAIPPTGGQGAAQAFEDAGFMARLLGEPTAVAKGYDQVFAHFEKIRKERFEHVRDLTAKSGSTRKSSPSALGWFFKKWSFWAFFAIKGDMRDNRLIGYDVTKESVEL